MPLDEILGIAKINKTKFARKIGVDRKTLVNWSANPVSMNLDYCSRIAEALQIDKADCFLALSGDCNREAFQRISFQLTRRIRLIQKGHLDRLELLQGRG